MRDDIANGLGNLWLDGPVSVGDRIWLVFETAQEITETQIQRLMGMQPALIVKNIKDQPTGTNQDGVQVGDRRLTVEAVIGSEQDILIAGIPKMSLSAFAVYASKFLTWAGIGYTLVDVAGNGQTVSQTVDQVGSTAGSALFKALWPILILLLLVMGVKLK